MLRIPCDIPMWIVDLLVLIRGKFGDVNVGISLVDFHYFGVDNLIQLLFLLLGSVNTSVISLDISFSSCLSWSLPSFRLD